MATIEGTVSAPIHVLGKDQMAGLRMSFFDINDDKGNLVASAQSGAGMGSPVVWLAFKPPGSERTVYAYIDTRDLLAHWLRKRWPRDAEAQRVIAALHPPKENTHERS